MFGDVFDSLGLDGDEYRVNHDRPATVEEARENIRTAQQLHAERFADGIPDTLEDIVNGAYIFVKDGWAYCGFGKALRTKTFSTLYRACKNRKGLDPQWVYDHYKEGEKI